MSKTLLLIFLGIAGLTIMYNQHRIETYEHAIDQYDKALDSCLLLRGKVIKRKRR